MPIEPSTGIIAHAIQLAIAPVFLLTGVASLLGVMATRLAQSGHRIEKARETRRPFGIASADTSSRPTNSFL